MDAFTAARRSGYKKNRFVLFYGSGLSSENEALRFLADDAILSRGPEAPQEPQARLNALTIDAAALLHLEELCGSVERGKSADLTVFRESPLENDPAALSAVLTMVCGEIVYQEE